MNYVIFAPDFKPLKVMWNDIRNKENVLFLNEPFIIPRFGLLQILSKKCPIISLLVKKSSFLYKYLLKPISFRLEDECIFIYMNPWNMFMAETGLLDYLKNKFPKSLHVIIFGDVRVAKNSDLNFLKKNYNFLFIYDKVEAERLNIDYIPPFYSKNFATPKIEEEKYDITFVGHAKNRLKQIIELYEIAKKKGYICKFYIVGAQAEDRKYPDEIIYSDKLIDEQTYFNEYIRKTKCLLELTLVGTEALTARVREAIVYDKKLLTNNAGIVKYPFYNDKMIKIFTNINEIDFHFLKEPKYSYNYNNEFSPIHFLNKIETKYWETIGGLQR